jgi:type I restriction enzyme M protein
MAEAKWCGHDSRGNLIPNNDLPKILDNYKRKKRQKSGYLGYNVKPTEITNFILAPRYYNPESVDELGKLTGTHNLLKIADLVESGVLEFSTGDEIGKMAYGTGDIPFIRTSDISNWEIKIDPKHGVSEEIYRQYAHRQDVQEGDILMVRDGTYLIGTCAFVSKYDTKILYQSHIYKIRVRKPDVISPYLLIAALSSKPVISQIQAKRFTQDIIDTLGNRVSELVLPLPKNSKKRKRIEDMVKRSIHDRVESRELARLAKVEIAEV